MFPRATQNKKFSPGPFLCILIFHILAISAIFTFSWPGLITFIVMTLLTGCFGITLGFHRLLTHCSFQTSRAFKRFLALCGCLALQGGPVRWVAIHRVHHKEADTPKDPHSSEEGFWWSHVGWNFYSDPVLESPDSLKRLAPDIYNDPVLRFMDQHFFLMFLGFAAILFVAGTLIQNWHLGLSLVIWGCIFRVVYVWHITWLVNSATHYWGYRTYPCGDKSLNNWWVALLTFGEGWHNNHHAYARSANIGFQWFEIDFAYGVLLLLKQLGLVSKINTMPTPA